MPYRIYDVTDELKDMIMDMGAKICGVQQTYGKNNRLVRDYKKDKYEYKTNIPELVDKIICECTKV